VDKVCVLAANTFRDVLHKRVVYVAVFLAVVGILVMLTPLAFLRMAKEAGESKVAEQVGASLVLGVLNMWSSGATLIGLFVGATAVSAEVKSKTIVTVLARPVGRAEYLLGKWLGIQLFVLLFVGVGAVAGCAAVHYFQVQPSGLFPLAIGELFVDAVFFCALSVALGAIMPPVAAGAGTVFAQLMPSLARPFLADPRPLVSWLALAGYYVGPAQMPVSLLGHSFAKELLNPSYGLYAQVLVENVLYAAAVMVVACGVFARREVRLSS